MRTYDRLEALKSFLHKHLCAGREMKTPGADYTITSMTKQEPRCYIAYYPAMPDESGLITEALTLAPSILILSNVGKLKEVEEKRFDRYSGVHRPQELGQTLAVQLLFCVYEPGIRLPGFAESEQSEKGLDMTLLREGTQQGVKTIFGWMDDCKELLLARQLIPGTDLFLHEAECNYGPYTDQNFIVDKRPLYYGVMNVVFGCYADDGRNSELDEFLK